MSGRAYLLEFSMPNFMFHAPRPTTSSGTTACRCDKPIFSGAA